MKASFIERRLSGWLQRQTSPSGVRKVVPAYGALASEIGNVRSENQDKAAIVKSVDGYGAPFVAALVTDGIGGMRDGSQCAALAIGAFVAELSQSSKQDASRPARWLEQSINAANLAVFREYLGNGGSTLVAVILHGNGGVHWVSAGDSRIYKLSQNELTQLTVDDTIAGQLGKKGVIPPEQSRILQFVGMGPEFSPHFGSEVWRHDDQYVLTTDGVHYLSESFEIFSRLVSQSEEIGFTAKRLIDLARWCGGPDNATVAVLRLPPESAGMNSGDEDGLSIWDAFGELQIQVQVESGVNVRSDTQSPMVDLGAEGANLSSRKGVSEKEFVDTPPKKTKSQKGAKKLSRPKKKEPTDEEKVQLDISFSTKLD